MASAFPPLQAAESAANAALSAGSLGVSDAAAFVAALREREAGGWLRSGTHPGSRQRAQEEAGAAAAACRALRAAAPSAALAGPGCVETALSFALNALRAPTAARAAAQALCALCDASAAHLAAAQVRAESELASPSMQFTPSPKEVTVPLSDGHLGSFSPTRALAESMLFVQAQALAPLLEAVDSAVSALMSALTLSPAGSALASWRDTAKGYVDGDAGPLGPRQRSAISSSLARVAAALPDPAAAAAALRSLAHGPASRLAELLLRVGTAAEAAGAQSRPPAERAAAREEAARAMRGAAGELCALGAVVERGAEVAGRSGVLSR